MESNCSVPVKSVEKETGKGCSAESVLVLMLVPLNQLNLYLVLRVQLPIKIF